MVSAGRWARWKNELELKAIAGRKEQCKGPSGTGMGCDREEREQLDVD